MHVVDVRGRFVAVLDVRQDDLVVGGVAVGQRHLVGLEQPADEAGRSEAGNRPLCTSPG